MQCLLVEVGLLYFHNPSKPILLAGMVFLPSEDTVLQVRCKYF